MRRELRVTKQMLTWSLIALVASMIINICMYVWGIGIIKDQPMLLEDQRDAGYADGFGDGFKEGSEDQAAKWVDAIIEWCYLGELEGSVCEDYEVKGL